MTSRKGAEVSQFGRGRTKRFQIGLKFQISNRWRRDRKHAIGAEEMISRQWTGLAKREEAENYTHHLKTHTFPELSKIEGFIEAFILRRTVDQGVEFLIVTDWESMDAIRKFAGEQPDLAVVPAEAQAMMIRYDSTVRHYEVEGRYKQ